MRVENMVQLPQEQNDPNDPYFPYQWYLVSLSRIHTHGFIIKINATQQCIESNAPLYKIIRWELSYNKQFRDNNNRPREIIYHRQSEYALATVPSCGTLESQYFCFSDNFFPTQLSSTIFHSRLFFLLSRKINTLIAPIYFIINRLKQKIIIKSNKAIKRYSISPQREELSPLLKLHMCEK